jgi:hypothetical protein
MATLNRMRRDVPRVGAESPFPEAVSRNIPEPMKPGQQ